MIKSVVTYANGTTTKATHPTPSDMAIALGLKLTARGFVCWDVKDTVNADFAGFDGDKVIVKGRYGSRAGEMEVFGYVSGQYGGREM